jgi:phosphoribosylanthranilate isomerase
VLDRFLDPSQRSLKVCGVTTAADAEELARLGVDALGVNFWPKSKRFLDPGMAGFLAGLKDRILRVGVFVNAGIDHPRSLFESGLIDVVQLHGDESDFEILELQAHGIPVIRALGIASAGDLEEAADCPAEAVLLDAHAPGVYGGTGQTIDWDAAASFVAIHPEKPVILAGGITPENARIAATTVRPAALDTASGSESAPGVKDFDKVAILLAATR